MHTVVFKSILKDGKQEGHPASPEYPHFSLSAEVGVPLFCGLSDRRFWHNKGDWDFLVAEY